MRTRALLSAFLFLLASPFFAEPLPVAVLQKSPLGHTDSPEAGLEISATFSQPMVALSGNEDMGALCPLTIVPPIQGRCRWKGTSTVVFEAAEGLKPATLYKVIVPKGTRSQVSGAETASETSWVFESIRPRLYSSSPSDGERWVDLKPRLFLQFNLDIEPASAGSSLELLEHEPGDGLENGKSVPIEVSAITRAEYEDLEKNGGIRRFHYFYVQRDRFLQVKPGRTLKKGKLYHLVLKKGLRPAGAHLGLEAEQAIRFSTWNDFSFAGCDQPSGCGSEVPTLRFSNPVEKRELFKHLEVTPDVERPDPSQAAESDLGEESGETRSFQLWGYKLKSNVAYRFRIDGALRDAFGNRLGKTQEFSFTPPDFCPSMHMPSGFGVLEGYLAPKHPVDATNVKDLKLQLRVVPERLFVPFYHWHQNRWNEDASLKDPDLEAQVSRGWTPEAERNVSVHSYLDLAEALSKKKGSLIDIRLDTRSALDNLVSVGITMKTGPDSTLIWTTDLKSGAPKGGVKVEVRTPDNKVGWSGRTDSIGLALAPGWRALGISKWKSWPRPEIYCLAYDEGGTAILGSNLHGGIEAWRFNISTDTPTPRARSGSLFTTAGSTAPASRCTSRPWYVSWNRAIGWPRAGTASS
jgi:hypothetical protein